MDVKVIIDHKVVLAIGAVVVGVVFAVRMDPAAIKEVSLFAVGASKKLAIADTCAC